MARGSVQIEATRSCAYSTSTEPLQRNYQMRKSASTFADHGNLSSTRYTLVNAWSPILGRLVLAKGTKLCLVLNFIISIRELPRYDTSFNCQISSSNDGSVLRGSSVKLQGSCLISFAARNSTRPTVPPIPSVLRLESVEFRCSSHFHDTHGYRGCHAWYGRGLLARRSASPRCITTTSLKVRLQGTLSCASEQPPLETYAITESTEMMSHKALE